jgi:hypothetical protein
VAFSPFLSITSTLAMILDVLFPNLCMTIPLEPTTISLESFMVALFPFIANISVLKSLNSPLAFSAQTKIEKISIAFLNGTPFAFVFYIVRLYYNCFKADLT